MVGERRSPLQATDGRYKSTRARAFIRNQTGSLGRGAADATLGLQSIKANVGQLADQPSRSSNVSALKLLRRHRSVISSASAETYRPLVKVGLFDLHSGGRVS